MQMRLHPAAFLRGLRRDQSLMPLDVMQRLDDGAAIEIEFLSSAVDVPVVRAHLRDELTRRQATTLEHQLTPPRMGHAHEIVVRRFRSQSSSHVRKRVRSLRVVRAMQRDDVTGADGIDDASPESEKVSPGLALVLRPERLANQVYRLLVSRTQLHLPSATRNLLNHGSNTTPVGAHCQLSGRP